MKIIKIIKKLIYIIDNNFIEKYSIIKSIKLLINKYLSQLSGRNLLDIGCGSKPYKTFFETQGVKYYGIDFFNYTKNPSYNQNQPDYYFSKDYLKSFKLKNFKNDSFDIITSFQVLEHHPKPEILFSEVKRILKPNGLFFLSFPFIWELHEEPNDYQRLTQYKIKLLCEENNFEIIDMVKRGNTLSTVSQLINLSFFNMRLHKLIKIPIYLIFLLPFQYLSFFLDYLFKDENRKIFLGYTFLIKKC